MPSDAGVLLVANPTSGRGRALRWAERAGERLRSEGVAWRIAASPGETSSLLGREPGRFAESWVFGGDGTLRGLLQLLPPDPPPRVALFPAGTGNVVAREAGVPLTFEGAWRVARAGAPRPFDLLRVNGERAAFMVSAGLDAELAHRVAADRRGPMRRADWVRAALASGRFAREAPLRVLADGADLGAARFAAAFNCGLYAGGFRVCPRARPDDGRIELLLLREPIRPRWAAVIWAALRHRPESLPDATLIGARAVELRDVACSQVDGDPGPVGTLRIEVLPAALRIRAPA